MGLKDELKNIQKKQEKEKKEAERRKTHVEIPDELAHQIADNIYRNVLESIKWSVKTKSNIQHDWGVFRVKYNYRYEVGIGKNGENGLTKKWGIQESMEVPYGFSVDRRSYEGIFPLNNGFIEAGEYVHDYEDWGEFLFCENLSIIHKIFSIVTKKYAKEGISCDYKIVDRGKDYIKHLVFYAIIPCNKHGDVK